MSEDRAMRAHTPRDGVSNYRLDTIIENSFRDFHARGFDYICLERAEAKTIKLYFFDGDVTKLSEVVNPHDHRYDFVTEVIVGSFRDFRYREDPNGDVFQRFAWQTPLNGGKGFSWSGENRMSKSMTNSLVKGQKLYTSFDMLHTIQIGSNETILKLTQMHDVMPIGKPTTTLMKGDNREPPSLSGLYRRWSNDDLAARLRKLGVAFE